MAATFLANAGDDPFKSGQTASDRALSKRDLQRQHCWNRRNVADDPWRLYQLGTVQQLRRNAGGDARPSSDYRPVDCTTLSFAALSTAVADVDNDGLPDGAEDANALYDADGTLLNYNTWGANSFHKDMFIEADAMATGPTSYGSASAPYSLLTSTVTANIASDGTGHSHMLQPVAAKILIDAYLFAPNYSNSPVPTPVQLRRTSMSETLQAISAPSMRWPTIRPVRITARVIRRTIHRYFIPEADAKGGELILETRCGLGPLPCQFQDYPGTMGFTRGLPIYASQHFDWSRLGYFHYLFSVHALAKPKSPYPCVVKNTGSADSCQLRRHGISCSAGGI